MEIKLASSLVLLLRKTLELNFFTVTKHIDSPAQHPTRRKTIQSTIRAQTTWYCQQHTIADKLELISMNEPSYSGTQQSILCDRASNLFDRFCFATSGQKLMCMRYEVVRI